jgi:hypothetical protein
MAVLAIAKPVTSRRLAGRQMDSSEQHPANAKSPRVESLGSVSKVTSERWLQSAKQKSAMISIDEGIQID